MPKGKVPKRVLMLVPALSMVYGGTSLTSIQLADAVGRRGIDVDVIATNADGDKDLAVPLGRWIQRGHYRVRYFPRWGKREFKISPALAVWLWQNLSNYDLMHTTSVFNFPALVGCLVAELRRVPFIVQPAGMLEPWALAYKAWKKRWYFSLLERPRLEHAGAIHCLTASEACRIRTLGIKTPLVIVPNGIDPADSAIPGDPAVFFADYPQLRPKTLLLFMHRVDPKKGLDLLASSFAAVLKRLPELPLHLVVAGPATDGFLPTAKRYFADVGCAAQVTFTGMLGGEIKRGALAAARVFVTPTYSEGFSLSVLEAMAAGLPGVLTTGCNFPEAGQVGAAHETPIESAAFADALTDLLTHPEAARRMGQRARRFVLDHYTWDQVAARAIDLYTALLNRTLTPCQVRDCLTP